MAILDDLAEKLEKRVQPNEDEYKFASPDDFKDLLEDALMEHNPALTWDTIPKEEQHLVLWLAMVQAYYQLATRHAENMRFRIENDEFHADQPVSAYTSLAKQYQSKYDENRNIQVTTVTRTQTGTGLKAGYYTGDTP